MVDGTLTVLYSCHRCGLHRTGVDVRCRDASEDVIVWMVSVVTPALCADHKARSPDCHPDKLSEVMIPLPSGAEFIGSPAKH